MSEEEREAARLLEPLRHFQPPAPTTVDVKQAARSGKRTVLIRQVAGTVACLVAVLGVAATLTLTGGEQPPATATGDFGATTQEFGIGSAGGFTPLTYETGVDRQRATLTAPGLDAEAVVTMYGKGISPHADGRKFTPSGEAADEIEGINAVWLDEPVTGDGDLELAWQWKPGAWAFARLAGSDVDRDGARKVALSLDPGAGIEVPSAVRLPDGLVADAELTGTLRSIGERERPELVSQVRYTVAGNPDHWITVGVRVPESDIGESTEIGDRPAIVNGRKVTFLDDTGLFIEVSEDLDLGMPVAELAEHVTADPDFAWPSTPPLSSPTGLEDSSSTSETETSSSSSTSESESPSEPTSGPTS